MAGDGTHGLDAALAAALRAAGPPGEVTHDAAARTLRLAAPAAVVVVPDRRRPDAEATAEAVGRLATESATESADPSLGPVVLVASSEIYEPSHHHPGMIAEAALNLRPGANPVARRWLEVEEAARERAAALGRPLAVLRAAPVPHAAGDDWASDLLTRRWAPTLPGHDPVMQLLALPDLAAAVLAAARHVERHGEAGTWNVVPAEVVPLRWALRLAGIRRLPAPAFVHRLLGRPRREPAERLAYLTYPWTASGDAARRDLGFAARHTSAEAVAALADADGSLEPPRVGLSFDDFGLSPDYIASWSRTGVRFLHDAWWRVEQRGVETVPLQGRAVLVGVHRGFMPFDGVMALHLLRREVGRIPRFLIHPTLVKFPFLFNFMTRLGGLHACYENAAWVLEREGLLAVFPEGIRGAFTPYRRAYRLGRFGRGEYVRMALLHRAPIHPFVTVGSAEIYPILGRLDWKWWKRFSEWPYLPLTPTFPFLPVPLPSKWSTRFLEPVPLDERYGPEAADDPEVVAGLCDEIEGRMQAAIDQLLARRRSIWWGSRFGEE